MLRRGETCVSRHSEGPLRQGKMVTGREASRMCRGVEAASRPCVEPDVEDVEARAQPTASRYGILYGPSLGFRKPSTVVNWYVVFCS